MATNFKPQIGIEQINTANSNLDGTGTITKVLTGDSTFGTMVPSVTIKSTGDVTEGMIRFFLRETDSDTWRLFREIEVLLVSQDDLSPAFLTTAYFTNLYLPPSVELGVSTQKAETFNIIASGLAIEGYSA